MSWEKIVVHFLDGRILKGFSSGFMPHREVFEFFPFAASIIQKAMKVSTSQLKGIFFVKDFDGNPGYDEFKQFDPKKKVIGRKVHVFFKDSEQIIGTILSHHPAWPGLLLTPVDPRSNNTRCYVVSSATRQILYE